MSKDNYNNNNNNDGCFSFLLLIALCCCLVFGFISYIDMKPKDEIKEEIIKKGDEFSVDSEDLSKYIDVLEDLNLSYKTSKDGDKIIIKINRPNK
jgi:hypothetical protein